jgi:hypothetical protein
MLLVPIAYPQRQAVPMLPSAIKLSGVVTDSEGTPLSGVRVDHTGTRSGIIQTDGQGHFEIETRAPAIVFRKNGFQSRYIRVANREKIALAITLTGPAPLAKECGPRPSCSSLRYFGSAFCLPKIHGVNVGKQGNDIDYGQRSFWIGTSAGKIAVQHAAGPMWGSGLPLDEQVWSATEYTETSYRDREGLSITDARGKRQERQILARVGVRLRERILPGCLRAGSDFAGPRARRRMFETNMVPGTPSLRNISTPSGTICGVTRE